MQDWEGLAHLAEHVTLASAAGVRLTEWVDEREGEVRACAASPAASPAAAAAAARRSYITHPSPPHANEEPPIKQKHEIGNAHV